MAYSPWGHKESDMTEQTHIHIYTVLTLKIQVPSHQITTHPTN